MGKLWSCHWFHPRTRDVLHQGRLSNNNCGLLLMAPHICAFWVLLSTTSNLNWRQNTVTCYIRYMHCVRCSGICNIHQSIHPVSAMVKNRITWFLCLNLFTDLINPLFFRSKVSEGSGTSGQRWCPWTVSAPSPQQQALILLSVHRLPVNCRWLCNVNAVKQ